MAQVSGPVFDVSTVFHDLGKDVNAYRFPNPRAFTGEFPLGQQMAPEVLVKAAGELGEFVCQHEAAELSGWAQQWASQEGAVERIWSRRVSLTNTATFIAGPLALHGHVQRAPAVQYSTFHAATRPERITTLFARMGFVDANGRFGDTSPSFRISSDALAALRGDTYSPDIPDFIRPLGRITYLAWRIIAASHDPLKATVSNVYRELTATPELAAQLRWKRSTAGDDRPDGVEVCFAPADPERFGPERMMVFVRDALKPDGVVVCYTDDEWEAFVDGAKKSEFDL